MKMQKPHLQILALDDDAMDLTILERFCKRLQRWDVTLIARMHQDDLDKALADHDPELLLIDYRLGPCKGTDVVQELRHKGCTLPIYMLTGHDELHVESEVLAAGADGCVSKQALSAERIEELLQSVLEH
jgi:DNA-binding NarL/FixJ family response regulator